MKLSYKYFVSYLATNTHGMVAISTNFPVTTWDDVIALKEKIEKDTGHKIITIINWKELEA